MFGSAPIQVNASKKKIFVMCHHRARHETSAQEVFLATREDFYFLWKRRWTTNPTLKVILAPQKPGILFVLVSKVELCYFWAAAGAGLLRIHLETCNWDDQRWKFRRMEPGPSHVDLCEPLWTKTKYKYLRKIWTLQGESPLLTYFFRTRVSIENYTSLLSAWCRFLLLM